MAEIKLHDITKRYGDGTEAVKHMSLDIADGEFMILVGPSGCGKSTALRMIAGLEDISEGELMIGDRVVNNLAPRDRDIAMVFQNYALYPHMTVRENMGFALKLAKVPQAEIDKKVNDAAATLDLTDHLERKPANLSGGQRQRVAMGRAIVRDPQVFLMDEPLSNLDAKLRVQTRGQIASLQRRLGVTTVYVTHDQVEAMTMGDRVAVLKDGILQQVDTPRRMYDHPNNVFVAGFIGSPAMNLLTIPLDGNTLKFGAGEVPVPREAAQGAGDRQVTVGVRPEDMNLVGEGQGLKTVVNVVEELGADAYVFGTAEVNGEEHDVIARVDGRKPPGKGESVNFAPAAGHLHLFSTTTGERLID
jgi:multiple sugar transport system ATP-binding protein